MPPAFAFPEDRLPPQNLEAERGVIGGVLIDNAELHEAAAIVRPEDFYRDSHQILWRAIVDLYGRGGPIDALILLDELRRRDEHAKAGGDEYLAEILASVPHAANTKYYAQITAEKATLRNLIQAHNDSLRDGYSGQSTAEEALEQSMRRLFAISDRLAGTGDVPVSKSMGEAMAAIHERQEGRATGLSTGLFELDRMIGGLLPGYVYVVAGRASMGKTALALHLFAHLGASLGIPALYVSLEMGQLELSIRMLGTFAGVPGDALRGIERLTPKHSSDLAAAYAVLKDAPLVIDDNPVHSPTQIYANARRHRHARDLGALFIDYLQLIEPEDGRGESRQEQVSKISRRIKTLAMSLKIPVVLLSQLNRGPEGREDHRPRLSDLRESGAIEQDADAVLLLYRPEYYDPNESAGVCEIIVAKQRNGRTGKVEVAFNAETNQFSDLAAGEVVGAGGEVVRKF